ncbi:MAG: D-alanyl-D-alanine carboxypeptidase family protein [Candidatus Merdivicinus sp.]|jgi:D-alanyl-D-alanine carboxypeptidase (penicillin-binding protein 5/6)
MKQKSSPTRVLRYAALAAAFSLAAAAVPLTAGADGLAEEAWLAEEETVVTTAQAQEIPAKSAILMDAESGQLLFEKNAHEKMPPASITKIMTLLLVMEAIENGSIGWDDMVSCSEHAASMGGTQIWLEPGEEMRLEDLIKAAAVNSANDASMALAEYVAGSEGAFVDLMNARAKELGMKDTTFVNPTGLDAEGHLSCAYDIALMSRELLRHSDITKYTTIWMDSLRDGKTGLTNTNKLVRFYEGCTGLKTGTTDGAGSCLSASATRQGLSLIAVSMGSTTSDERFASCRTLLNYGFSSFESFTPEVPQEELAPISVTRGVQETVPLTLSSTGPILIAKGKSGEVIRTVELELEAEAPVAEGQQLGQASFTLDGRVLAEIPILAGCEVKRMSFSTAFSMLLQSLLG